MRKWIIGLVATGTLTAIGYLGLKFRRKKILEQYQGAVEYADDFYKKILSMHDLEVTNMATLDSPEQKWTDSYAGLINGAPFLFHVIVDSHAESHGTNEDRVYCLEWDDVVIVMAFGPQDNDLGAEVFHGIYRTLKRMHQDSSSSQPS